MDVVKNGLVWCLLVDFNFLFFVVIVVILVDLRCFLWFMKVGLEVMFLIFLWEDDKFLYFIFYRKIIKCFYIIKWKYL